MNIYVVTADSTYDTYVREDHFFTTLEAATNCFEKNSGLNPVLSIAVDHDDCLVPGEILRDEATELEAAETAAAAEKAVEATANAQAKYWEDLEDYFRRR